MVPPDREVGAMAAIGNGHDRRSKRWSATPAGNASACP
jgi:hypothetical protein